VNRPPTKTSAIDWQSLGWRLFVEAVRAAGGAEHALVGKPSVLRGLLDWHSDSHISGLSDMRTRGPLLVSSDVKRVEILYNRRRAEWGTCSWVWLEEANEGIGRCQPTMVRDQTACSRWSLLDKTVER